MAKDFKSSFGKKDTLKTSQPVNSGNFSCLSAENTSDKGVSPQATNILQNNFSAMPANILVGGVGVDPLRNIAISSIHSFKNHPFKVLDNSDMDELISSVEANGIITPIIVRPVGLGEYECISGHRRIHAASKLGLTSVPAVIKQLSDDEAVIAMVDANEQREFILPSEKAFSLKMKLDAMVRMDKSNIQGDVDSRSLVAEKEGMTRTQVYRYIRLTSLIPQLLEKVDSGDLVFNAGYEIAAYCENAQHAIFEYLDKGNSIKLKELPLLQQFKENNFVTSDEIEAVLKKKKSPNEGVTLSSKVVSKYFPPNFTKKERTEIIVSLLEKWKEENYPNM